MPLLTRLLKPLRLPCLLVGAALSATPLHASDHLKIATYNTHLVPPGLRCAEQLNVELLLAAGAISFSSGTLTAIAIAAVPESLALLECLTFGDDISFEEALPLANEVLERDFDVIAFNEVFDEDARQRLVHLLRPEFPHSIDYISSGPDLEDSGLMLFSKFPFDNLQNPNAVFTDGTVRGTTDQVAFVEFGDCSGFDCLASKGAAFVRIRNTRSNAQFSTYDVVFTHMQAAYDSDDEHAGVRKEQFRAIQSLVRHATGDNQTGPLFILGDVNIEGEGANWDEAGSVAVAGGQEWREFVQAARGDPQVTDSWAATTSLRDRGITTHGGSLGDQRLDYVLANSVDQSLCVQHLTNAYLGNSDHIAVIADTNRAGHFCNPRRALQKPPFDTLLTSLTEIAVPGAMQWFFVELPPEATGAAVGVTNRFDPGSQQGVSVELYAPHNLTTPIPPTSTETFVFGRATTQKYVLPREFFVRAFSPNRNWTGDYDLLIHLLTCATPHEACPLQVNNPDRFTDLFVAGTALGPDDNAWFEVRVNDRADSGEEQTLRFQADGFQDNLIRLELFDNSNPPVPFALNNQTTSTTAGSAAIAGTALGPLPLLMRAVRTDVNRGTALRVGWESNLTRLGGVPINVPGARSVNLVCDDETDGALGSEAGSDEIALWMRVDMQPFRQVFYREFDCNNGGVRQILDNELGVIRFLDEVVFTLYEEDTDTIFNPNDESQWNIQKPLPASRFPPSQDIPPGADDIRVENSTNFARWDFEGGRYHLEYSLSHQLTP